MSYAHTQPTSSTSNAYLPIEDYGAIGDLYTVALVGKNGSIDWCCLPDFDSPSVFGAILDSSKGGFFRIAPTETSGTDLKQMYLPNTNILITRFLAAGGVSEITGFMPIKHQGSAQSEHHLIRAVHVVNGSHTFEIACRPAFNYARDSHSVTVSNSEVVFHSDSLELALSSSVQLEEAELALEQMLTYANHVGPYAEEIGIGGEALGNFPQAFTHLALIEACYHVDQALNNTINMSEYSARGIF